MSHPISSRGYHGHPMGHLGYLPNGQAWAGPVPAPQSMQSWSGAGPGSQQYQHQQHQQQRQHSSSAQQHRVSINPHAKQVSHQRSDPPRPYDARNMYQSAAYKAEADAYRRHQAHIKETGKHAWIPGGNHTSHRVAGKHADENPRAVARRLRPRGNRGSSEDNENQVALGEDVIDDDGHDDDDDDIGADGDGRNTHLTQEEPRRASHEVPAHIVNPRAAEFHAVGRDNAYSLHDTSDDPMRLAMYDQLQQQQKARLASTKSSSSSPPATTTTVAPVVSSPIVPPLRLGQVRRTGSADTGGELSRTSSTGDSQTQTSISFADATEPTPVLPKSPRERRVTSARRHHPHSPPKKKDGSSSRKTKTPNVLATPRYRAPHVAVGVQGSDPTLDEARQAIRSIRPNDISTMRCMRQPPAGIVYVMEAVCILTGVVPEIEEQKEWGETKTFDFWVTSRKIMREARKFLDVLYNTDPKTISQDTLEELGEYMANADFIPSKLHKVSQTASSLCTWVRGIYKAASEHLALESAQIPAEETLYQLETPRRPVPSSRYQNAIENPKGSNVDLDAAYPPDPTGANHIARLDESSLLRIFSMLSPFDLGRLGMVCRRFYNLSQDPMIWEYLFEKNNERLERALVPTRAGAVRDRLFRAIAQIKQMPKDEWGAVSGYRHRPANDICNVMISLAVIMNRKATWASARSFLQTCHSLRDLILGFHPRSISRSQIIKLRRAPAFSPGDIRDAAKPGDDSDITLRHAVSKIGYWIQQLELYGRILHKIGIPSEQQIARLNRTVQICAIMGNRDNITRLVTPEYSTTSSPVRDPTADDTAHSPRTPGQDGDIDIEGTPNDAREDIVFLSRSPATPATPGSAADRADKDRDSIIPAGKDEEEKNETEVANQVYQEYMHAHGFQSTGGVANLRAQSAYQPAHYQPGHPVSRGPQGVHQHTRYAPQYKDNHRLRPAKSATAFPQYHQHGPNPYPVGAWGGASGYSQGHQYPSAQGYGGQMSRRGYRY